MGYLSDYYAAKDAERADGSVDWSFRWDHDAAVYTFEQEVDWWCGDYDFSVTLWALDLAEMPTTGDAREELTDLLDDVFWDNLPTRGEPPREITLPNELGTARLIRRAWKYHEREEEA